MVDLSPENRKDLLKKLAEKFLNKKNVSKDAECEEFNFENKHKEKPMSMDDDNINFDNNLDSYVDENDGDSFLNINRFNGRTM